MMILPNKTRIQQALAILEEEEFTEYIKQRLKEELFKLDLVTLDDEMIASEVITSRESAQKLDWFMNQMREFINE